MKIQVKHVASSTSPLKVTNPVEVFRQSRSRPASSWWSAR